MTLDEQTKPRDANRQQGGISSRNKIFDLLFLRILFALLVLLSHAPELTDGNRSRELLTRLTHAHVSFGEFGVDGFFLLSGYLIVQSWVHDPNLLSFLQKRLLRIVPGYLVAVAVSLIVVGLCASAVPHFFLDYAHSIRGYLASVLLLDAPASPRVFPGDSYHMVNGSLWTIPYEFRCYLLVALLGLCGFLKRPALWLALTVALLVLFASLKLQALLSWTRHIPIFGEPTFTFRLVFIYFVGACFFLFRKHIVFRPAFAAIAMVLILISCARYSNYEPWAPICGGYLLFYLGQLPGLVPRALHHLPDISYGLYLYGWPVEALWIYKTHTTPWITFFVSTILCALLGWLSWHFVERPALRWKKRPAAVLPSP